MSNSIPRIPPPFYLLASVILMLVLNRYFPIYRWLEFPWRYFGILIIVAGFMLIITNARLFRSLGTKLRPGLKATVLVTKGAYRYTRNPIYLGMVVILIGVDILLGTVSPLLMVLILIAILHYRFILQEEKWMESWFGEPYLKYRKTTRRWL